MVTIIKYKKITINHNIYIKVFSDGTVSYITIFTDDVLDNDNDETTVTELRKVFEEAFELKFKKDLSLNTWMLGFLNILLG